MKKRDKFVLAFSIFGLLLLVVGVTYAYFTAIITGKEVASTISLTGGVMTIEYSENSNVILIENIYPREEAWFTKTITLTGTNTTDLQMKYDLGINVTTNSFSHYLSYDLTLLEGDNGTPIPNITGKAINGTGYKRFGVGVFNTANAEIHKYELKIYLKDNNLNQNNVQNGVFNAKVVVDEAGTADPNEEIAMFLTGKEINLKMKNLANKANNDETEVTSNYTDNTTITGFQRSNTLKEGLTEENIASTDTSAYPIYMWYEDGVIYYYTEANKYYLNSDASWMFGFLSNLTDINELSNLNTSNISNMGAMFAGDISITSLEPLSNWDVSNVEYMHNMFSGPNFQNYMQIESLKPLANWDISNVTSISFMFSMNSFTSLEGLENWDTSNVMYISSTFLYCSNVKDLKPLANWDTSKNQALFQAFTKMSSLTSLEGLENWDTSKVENMESAFMSCSSLEDIDEIKNWDTSNVTTMRSMFSDCSSLKELDFGNYDLNKLTNTSLILERCSNLERFKTPKVYPTNSGVKINLPITLKDSLGTSYTSLGAGNPTSTWLTK